MNAIILAASILAPRPVAVLPTVQQTEAHESSDEAGNDSDNRASRTADIQTSTRTEQMESSVKEGTDSTAPSRSGSDFDPEIDLTAIGGMNMVQSGKVAPFGQVTAALTDREKGDLRSARLRIALNDRLRARFETNQRIDPDGTSGGLNAISEEREGERFGARLNADFNRPNGASVRLEANASGTWQTTIERETFSSNAISELQDQQIRQGSIAGEYESPRDWPVRLRTRHELANTSDFRVQSVFAVPAHPPSTIREFESEERSLLNSVELEWEGNRLGRIRFELDIEENSRANAFAEKGARTGSSFTFVRESRVEPGLSWHGKVERDIHLVARLDLESLDFRAEGTTGENQRSTLDLKPTLTATTRFDHTRLKLWATRSVTPLDLRDFGTVFDEIDDEIQVGNLDILPQRSWETGIEWRQEIRRFDGNLSVAYQASRISDLIDFVAGAGNTTVPGNLGNGTAHQIDVEMEASIPVPGTGKPELSFEYTFLDTSVFDPLLNVRRSFAETPRHRYQVAIKQSLGAPRISLNLELEGVSEQITVEQDRVDRERISAPVLGAELQFGIAEGFAKLTVANVLDSEDVRERTRFSGLPADGEIRRTEIRRRAPGRTLRFSFEQTF